MANKELATLPEQHQEALLFHPQPAFQESLRGYLTRLADCNHSMSFFRPHLQTLAAATEAIPRISALAKVQASDLRKMLTVSQLSTTGDDMVRINDQTIGIHGVVRKGRRVCPRCLKKMRVSKLTWELKAITGCWRHRCQLLNLCPACGRQLEWGTGAVDHCSCGYDLTTATVPRTDAATATRNLLIEEALFPSQEGIERLKRGGLYYAWQLDFPWLHLLMDAIETILFERDLQRCNGDPLRGTAYPLDDILLQILDDKPYVLNMRARIFAEAARNPMVQARSMTPGHSIGNLEMLFGQCLSDLPTHVSIQKQRFHRPRKPKQPTKSSCQSRFGVQSDAGHPA